MRHGRFSWFGILLILLGIGFFSYPDIHTWLQEARTAAYVEEFQRNGQREKIAARETEEAEVMEAEAMGSEAIGSEEVVPDPAYEEILRYNTRLYEENQADFQDAWIITQSPISLSMLPDASFGYLEIPAMRVTLPLYIGASAEHMALGAAVLGQTSIPIGGENTNSVIAGHRGYQGIPFLRDIELLEIGEEIYLTNPWETLVYRVTATAIIDPYDSDALRIQEGKDMITLITCHPYRSHGRYRYLVYCERVLPDAPPEEERESEEIHAEETLLTSIPDIQKEIRTRRAAAVLIILMLLAVMMTNKRGQEEHET